jgi:hypothetical protein
MAFFPARPGPEPVILVGRSLRERLQTVNGFAARAKEKGAPETGAP